MYIIVIAWLYVTLLMALTERSIVAGILTFGFYGLLPCAILMWILGVKHRRFKQLQSDQENNQTLSDTLTPEKNESKQSS